MLRHASPVVCYGRDDGDDCGASSQGADYRLRPSPPDASNAMDELMKRRRMNGVALRTDPRKKRARAAAVAARARAATRASQSLPARGVARGREESVAARFPRGPERGRRGRRRRRAPGRAAVVGPLEPVPRRRGRGCRRRRRGQGRDHAEPEVSRRR
mmetsp:Transcript_22978/g.52091  ORF Transcript_22978/g.52091 Transcript_22978/m.52091 type:complete len:158 (+) Transcript_22978:277-750(+)